MKRRTLAAMVLSLVMCLGMSLPAWAAATATEVMPSEIMAALADEPMRIQAGVMGVSSADNDLLESIALPTSLNIDTINIDMNKVHQTYPMTDDQINFLKERGYSDEEIAKLDMGDFFNIEASLTINPNIIRYIKKIYPELADVDVSKWTYGDLNAYAREADAKKYAPTEEQAKQLNERGITLSDAKTLLKDYYTYDNILAQPDEQLAEDIQAYYQFTIDNISEMAKYEEVSDNIYAMYPSTNPDPDYYIAVDFPGYKKLGFMSIPVRVMRILEQNKLLPHKLHMNVYMILLEVL